MITITIQFDSPTAVDQTLLAGLGKLPAEISFQVIKQIHAQIEAQVTAEQEAAKQKIADAAELETLRKQLAEGVPPLLQPSALGEAVRDVLHSDSPAE